MNDIIKTSDINNDDKRLEKQISFFLILNVVQKIHSTAIDIVFNKMMNSFLQMSIIKTLSVHQTQFQQLEVIIKNERTLSDIMQVHENIFLNQLDFSINDDVFLHHLFSVYENALFIKLICSVKLEQFNSTHVFDCQK